MVGFRGVTHAKKDMYLFNSAGKGLAVMAHPFASFASKKSRKDVPLQLALSSQCGIDTYRLGARTASGSTANPPKVEEISVPSAYPSFRASRAVFSAAEY